jgi:hypothetical protein
MATVRALALVALAMRVLGATEGVAEGEYGLFL